MSIAAPPPLRSRRQPDDPMQPAKQAASRPSPYPGMGAALAAGGCSFRIWAPWAEKVEVVGSFAASNWTPIELCRDGTTGPGAEYWSAYVPNVDSGGQPPVEYKFRIWHEGQLLWRVDPYCRDATGHGGNSIVRDPSFNWSGFGMPNWNDLVIYELHVGTFNDEPGSTKGGTFAELMDGLDYLRDLGINAIEVLPAADFDTETSMGYNPSLLFAVEEGYGDPAALRKAVNAAHVRGIAVIFDVVYNHAGPDGLGECLWRLNGWSEGSHGGIYFYQDDRARTDYGDENRFDYGRSQVRQFLRDNAMMWLHDYRADGLRLDSTFNIRRARGKGNDYGELPEGWALMQWIADDKDRELPWNILIAEDLQGNEWLTKPTCQGGAGCNSQWDVGFYHAIKDAVVQPLDEWRDMERVRQAIYGRYNGDAFQRIIYSESHDEVTVQNDVALGRMPEKIWWGHADSWEARKRSTLAAALVFTSPGIPMIFQGQEFLEWGTWRDKTPLDWSKEKQFAGILNLYRDLIRLRRNWYNNTRGLRGQHVNVFHVNYEAKVVAFHRWADGGPGDDVIVVANFANRRYDSYNIGFPRPGTWYLRFNSDWRGYSQDYSDTGYNTVAEPAGNQGMPCSGNVGLGAYSAIILSQ